MRNVTLCFLVRDGEICLAMKKRGFGKGKWNGVGGKQEEGELITTTALRELAEEIGVETEERHLMKVGDISFHFLDNKEFNQRMHIYFVTSWKGEPSESDEMKPAWYTHETIPYHDMWVDDPVWLPKVLAGKKVKGACYFNHDGSDIEKFDLEEW